jgi:hypothetical protein
MEADPDRRHEQLATDLDPDANPAMMEQKLERPQPSQAEGEDEAGETGEG